MVLNSLGVTSIPPVPKIGHVHAFDIVAHILKDDGLSHTAHADFVEQFGEIIAQYSPFIKEHAEKWTVDLTQPGEIERKVEELIWLSSLLYGAGGLAPNGFQSDFFLCVICPLTMNNVS